MPAAARGQCAGLPRQRLAHDQRAVMLAAPSGTGGAGMNRATPHHVQQDDEDLNLTPLKGKTFGLEFYFVPDPI